MRVEDILKTLLNETGKTKAQLGREVGIDPTKQNPSDIISKRIKQKNISINLLSEMLENMGYSLAVIPKNTLAPDSKYYKVTFDDSNPPNEEDLAKTVAKKLLDKGLTLSSTEACTGGLFAARMTELAGSSRFFDRSIVTYSNQAKLDHLGVSPDTLEKFGAVSPETAREMAVGLAQVSGSDVCISVTGIAGPGGGTEEKPVGTVFMAVVYQGQTHTVQAPTVNVDRSYNRNHSVLSMLDLLNQLL